MMKIFSAIPDLQKWAMEEKRKGSVIGLVPTMGYLHAGHLSLIDAARQSGADKIVVSIFVNPIQFGPTEDYDKYPRDFERDRAMCEEKHVDAIFAPSVNDMYPEPITCHVEETMISRNLCGKSRPVHFQGVATVVAKLFHAALPDLAVFGRKDAQQAAVIRRMVRDLNFPVRIVVAPIVRESDGLAMSSRNKYLSSAERKHALVLSRSLKAAKEMSDDLLTNSWEEIRKFIVSEIEKESGVVDYVELADSDTMIPVKALEQGKEYTIAAAAKFGTTRLIDNIQIKL